MNINKLTGPTVVGRHPRARKRSGWPYLRIHFAWSQRAVGEGKDLFITGTDRRPWCTAGTPWCRRSTGKDQEKRAKLCKARHWNHGERQLCCLTDKFQLRRTKLNRAVDTSEARASARTIAPPPAANSVSRCHDRYLNSLSRRSRRPCTIASTSIASGRGR